MNKDEIISCKVDSEDIAVVCTTKEGKLIKARYQPSFGEPMKEQMLWCSEEPRDEEEIIKDLKGEYSDTEARFSAVASPYDVIHKMKDEGCKEVILSQDKVVQVTKEDIEKYNED